MISQDCLSSLSFDWDTYRSSSSNIGMMFSCSFAASNWRYLTSCSSHVACCWNHDDSTLMWQRYACILLWLNLGSKSQKSWNTVFLTLSCKDSGGGFSSFKSGVNMFPKEDSFIYMVFVHCLGEEYNWKIKQNLIT